MAKHFRPSMWAAIMVVPLPENGSYTKSPFLELLRMGRAMHSTGFCVEWPVSDFLGLGMSQTVVSSPDNAITPPVFRWTDKHPLSRAEYVGNVPPHGLLLAVADKPAWTAGPDRVPAWLVHWVVIPAPDHQLTLGPNYLGAEGEPFFFQAGGDNVGHDASVPHVGHIAREMLPGIPPIGNVVV